GILTPLHYESTELVLYQISSKSQQENWPQISQITG
ncbi:unnamed protein product, partial [marine sediment metagenome]